MNKGASTYLHTPKIDGVAKTPIGGERKFYQEPHSEMYIRGLRLCRGISCLLPGGVREATYMLRKSKVGGLIATIE